MTAGPGALGHQIRALGIHDPAADAPTADGLGWVTGDCLDPNVVDAAVQGIDAVVHLAGNPGEDSLPNTLVSHVHTTGVILDAMVRHNVGKVAFASSNHAVGRSPRQELLLTATRPRPDTFYGVAKVATEALLSLYADRYDMTAVAMRIGSFLPSPTNRRALETWLSPDDCVRMVQAAITLAPKGFHVWYGISANTRGWWDLEPGRELGFDPVDNSEEFIDQVRTRPTDDEEAGYAGGEFALPAAYRDAFDRS